MAWTRVLPAGPSTSRASHVFVYDEVRNGCVVFGGRAPDDEGVSLQDTGTWDGNQWRSVSARYGRRGYVSCAFDSARQRTVVYGGLDLDEFANVVYFADTWEFDGTNWSRRTSSAALGERSSGGLAYDEKRQLTLLFGGYDGTWKDDLWAWDGSAWAPLCASATCAFANRPSPRANATFVYDEEREVLVLFGGFADGTSYADTWVWDGQSWSEIHPDHVPIARDSAAGAYDPVTKRVLMFGGIASTLDVLDDLWAWDGRDWTYIAATDGPAARQGAGLAWDRERRRGVLFGGRAEDEATDAWEFTLVGNPCRTSDDCHSRSCIEQRCALADASGTATSGSGGGDDGGSGGTAGAQAGSGHGEAEPPRVGSSGAAPLDGAAARSRPADRSFYSCTIAPNGQSTPQPVPFAWLLATAAAALCRRTATTRDKRRPQPGSMQALRIGVDPERPRRSTAAQYSI